MKNTLVLEMLKAGRLGELEKKLEDEIYQESLKRNPDEKKRYAAMKKYFSYVSSAREVLQKPYQVKYEHIWYTSFCNSYSLVLTTEVTGNIELFDSTSGTYPDVTRLINCNGSSSEINFTKVLAKAKSKGYKLKKSEVSTNNYLMYYDGAYFRIGLLDITYAIINDGKNSTVYHKKGNSGSPITIVNDIGYAVIMPVRIDDEIDEKWVVIKVEEGDE